MQHVRHDRFMNVDQKKFSREIFFVVNSLIVDRNVMIVFLTLKLLLNRIVCTCESFFRQLFLFFEKHLTNYAMSIVFDIRYHNLFFIIAYEVDDDEKTLTILIVCTTNNHFFVLNAVFDD